MININFDEATVGHNIAVQTRNNRWHTSQVMEVYPS